MSSCIVLKDEYTPTDGVMHNNRLNDIVSVVEPNDILLADVEYCPPSYGDPTPNHDTSTYMVVMYDHGLRLITLPSSTPNSLLPIMKIETVNFVS